MRFSPPTCQRLVRDTEVTEEDGFLCVLCVSVVNKSIFWEL
jgi:hypothetical protein